MTTRRRRTRQFGTVRRLPSGRFEARYTVDKHKHSRTFDTKAAASAWLDLRSAEVQTGQWRDPEAGAALFGEYAEHWIATREVRGRPIRERTQAHYRAIL